MSEIPVGSRNIARLFSECWNADVRPVFLDHYLTQRSSPVSTALAEALDDVAGKLSKMTALERTRFLASWSPQLRWWLLHYPLPFPNEIRRIAYWWIYDIICRKFSQFDDELLDQPATLLEEFPELRYLIHPKDKMLCLYAKTREMRRVLNDITFEEDGIRYKGFAVYYHPWFMVNTVSHNAEFIRTFLNMWKQLGYDGEYRIAIDVTRFAEIGVPLRYERKDYWHGPRGVDENRIDVMQSRPVSVYQRSEYHNQVMPNRLDRTEFYWKPQIENRDGKKTRMMVFEAEEISSCNESSKRIFNRYVHSERNVDLRSFTHIDGAIKAYHNHNYSRRHTQKMPKEVRADIKLKLFRIDARVDFGQWAELVGRFFAHNELVREYLEAESPASDAPD